MSTFSIKELEHLTGVKTHTLRIWEQRYKLIQPNRTTTNIRFYNIENLKALLNVVLLKENGFKISKIANLTKGEIQREIIQLTDSQFKFKKQIHALTICMVGLDEDTFQEMMLNSIQEMGFEKTMVNIIFPFLSKLGILWQTGVINPAQEHFISNLIRQKLFSFIDSQNLSIRKPKKKYLLFLPFGEIHELTLLFGHFLIKSRNFKSIYLGQSLPIDELYEVYRVHKPDYLLTVITISSQLEELEEYFQKLSNRFAHCKIILMGYVVNNFLNFSENIVPLLGVEQLISFLDNHSETAN